MSGEPDKSIIERIHVSYKKADNFAELVKIAIQMSIGLILTVLVVSRGLEYLGVHIPFNVPDDNPLEIVGKGLMVSAGIELAYMLFTEGPDEAVEPLILGISSAALITASQEFLGVREAIVIALLCGAIVALFHVREKHTKRKKTS
jgi:hypothetical protein